MNSFMPPRFPGSFAMPLLTIAPATRRSGNRAQLHEEITAVFDLLRDPLLRYLWTFGLEIQDSEEVLQDVFLSLFQHLDRGKPVDNVRGWLFRVAHNLALRRRFRTRRDATAQLDTTCEEWTVDPAPNPEDRLASRQAQKRVMAVVEALPEQDRRCLFLRAEGLRYREIGEVLDMSLGGVSLSLTRSLARIARSAER
jgi:RNA polymerase sigma-70 factor (ECF subfamily)